MVRITLFGHEDPIHTHVKITKDGVGKIVDAVSVSSIVDIGVGQVGFQSLIPSRKIGQTHFDLKVEIIQMVIIVRGGVGKRDGSHTSQGLLKCHDP